MAEHGYSHHSVGRDKNGPYEHHGDGRSWSTPNPSHAPKEGIGGWGKAAIIAGLAAAGALGYMAKDGGREGRSNAPVSGEPSRGEGPRGNTEASDTDVETQTVTTTETHVEDRPITIEGNIGYVRLEAPAGLNSGDTVPGVLILDNADNFGACPEDEGCVATLRGIPNTEHSGALGGSFPVQDVDGRNMVIFGIPETITFDGRTVTVDPDHTRLRIGEGEVMPLESILRHPGPARELPGNRRDD